jgi:hypothetical protein
MCGYAFSSAGSSLPQHPSQVQRVDFGDPSGCFASLDDEKTLTFSACFNHTLLATASANSNIFGTLGQENHV